MTRLDDADVTTTVRTSGSTPASPWPAFVVSAAVSYISTLDMSIVNVAFAEIAKTFPHASRGGISWVVTAYSIMFGSLLVVSGRMADRTGRSRMLQLGIVLFAAGSIVCALAPGLALLIAGRAVQGVGGAMVIPSSLGLLLAAFPGERRSQMVALNGAVGALGVASGPTLGALLVSWFGWRSAFWINVPICAFVIVLARRRVRELRQHPGPRPDVGASVVITLAVASLVWAISRAETRGWTDSSVLVLFAASAVLAAVVLHRTLHHPVPLLPPALFRERRFTVATVSTFLFGAAFSANILNNVLFLRTIWHYGVVKAGLYSALAPAVVAVSSVAAGRFMRSHPAGFRSLLVTAQLGYGLVAGAMAVVLTTHPTPWARWLPLMAVLGVMIGFSFPVLAAAAVSQLSAEHFALGGAVNNTARQVGAAVGVALVVTVQATADGIGGFRAGWRLVVVCSVLAALASLAQPGSQQG